MSDPAAVAAVGVLVAAAIAFVAWPFVSPEREPPAQALSPGERRRIELAERRDAAYAALRDLEHDRRTGKLGVEDYEHERRRLRAEAAGALRELDRIDSGDG